MLDYSKSFDARSLTPAEARTVVGLCTQILSCAGSVKSLAAAVAAESSSYKAEGYRSPEEQLARETGMSPTQARRALATGRRMLEQPDVAKAALSGELSGEQAQAVCAGAEANPARTAELLETAREKSLPELNEAVAKVLGEAVDLEARRRAIHARRRLARFTDTEGEYHAFLSGDPGDGITIDRVLTEIRRRLTTSRRERQIPNEKFETLDYDAMVALFDLACGKESEISLLDLFDIGLFPQFDPSAMTTLGPSEGSPPSPKPPRAAPTAAASGAGPAGAPTSDPSGGSGLLSLFPADVPDAPAGPAGQSAGGLGGTSPPAESPPDPQPPVSPPDPPPSASPAKSKSRSRLAGRPAKIIIRIDMDTLLRGYPVEGETCDCPGYGPIPVSLVHDLMAAGQARLAGFITKGKELRAVHLDRRHPNEYQKTALDYLYPVCAVKGCNTRAGLEADHREDWARTHYTVIDLLDYLCWHHHQLKTRQGWALVDGHGKRDFVAPGDPRHPRHGRDPGRAGPPGSAGSPPGPGAGAGLPDPAQMAMEGSEPACRGLPA